MSTASSGSPLRRMQRSALLHAGGGCDLRCAVCDCAAQSSSPADVARALDGGGARLVVRGATEHGPAVGALVARARQEGYAEIVLRTNAIAAQSRQAAAAFARLGADVALVPLFSQMQGVHDRIAGRPRALIDALSGMRHLAQAGLGIEVEVPILPVRLQKLETVVRLARNAVPSLRAVRFFVPPGLVPKVVAPPSWEVAGAALAEALLVCRELGIKARLASDTGVPLCALRDHPDLYDAYALNPRARSSTRGGATLGAACRACAVRAQCAGIMPSYRAEHGEAGIAPYARKPPLMYEQRTTRRRVWTAEQRQAASKADLLVLRPTVNCNQDCTFCSANETSANVWAKHEDMLRAIARAARRRINRLSFSGGEPTLSKHLAEYVHAASRLGIPEVELVTNGVLLSKAEKATALVAAGLTHAFVSLHAHDEALSLQSTQKVGDFERTVQAVRHLVGAGVQTALNHVITARNYPYLREYVEFVRREFGGRVKISFAFVTPQFKALDNIEVMPRLSVVMPYLKRAMYRALEIGQPFSIGSRQGIPFCFLDEFRAWSDGFVLSNSAIAEDAPQKQRGPVCDQCRFSNYCTGLWRPYAAQFGFDELRPVAGAKFCDDDVRALSVGAMPEPWGVPRRFEEVPAAVRERDLELGPPEIPTPPLSEHLPAFVAHHTRPLRIAMLGSGRQARRLGRAARGVPGLSIDAVASPHAPQADLQDFGDCPAYADAAAALDDICPDGAIVAAATAAHDELTRLAIARRVPVLVEKPLAGSEEQAEALCATARAAGARVVMAHNSLHAPGLDEVLAVPLRRPAATYVLRRTPDSGDAMRTWSRSFLYETVYHVLAVVGRACGGAEGEVVKASYRGESRPEQLRLQVRYGEALADVTLDYTASVEEDALARREGDTAAGEHVWRRQGRSTTITDAAGVRTVEADGNDVQRMLANFRDVVRGHAEPGATLDEALEVMRTARRVVDAVAAAGAPFERPHAPKHVASRAVQQPFH
jgi:MoaA/NifB/PqqE/SkfB family radical SAM enzyme/predicted dehydrogenase